MDNGNAVALDVCVMAKKQITQKVLANILRRRKKIADLEAGLKELEDALTADLKAGFEVAPGILTARIKSFEKRSVQWKSVVERELGEDYAARVLAATRPATYESLVVESV